MERVFEEGASFLDKGIFPDADLLTQCIADMELEEKPELMIFGKACKQQRNVGFFSDESIGYEYSRKLMPSKPLSSAMVQVLALMNEIMGTEYNGILVNQYMDGNDYISAHSDSQVGLDPVGVVAISYGAERKFRIRKDKKIVHDELTTHCSILHMGGDFQKHFTHEIPKEKVNGCRISFTFRKHNK